MVYDYFFGTYLGMLELVATIFLILNVYLLAKQKLINYWFGLVGVGIFGYIFFEYKLYSDMLLQWAFFAPLQIVGWYVWKYSNTLGEFATGELDSMRIVVIDNQNRIIWVAIIIAGAIMLGSSMDHYTDASFPFADALTTSMSIVASILLLKKVLESWIIWIAMDLIAIPIYFQKELYVTSGLYVIFLGLAVYGLISWIWEYQER